MSICFDIVPNNMQKKNDTESTALMSSRVYRYIFYVHMGEKHSNLPVFGFNTPTSGRIPN